MRHSFVAMMGVAFVGVSVGLAACGGGDVCERQDRWFESSCDDMPDVPYRTLDECRVVVASCSSEDLVTLDQLIDCFETFPCNQDSMGRCFIRHRDALSQACIDAYTDF